MTLSNMLTCFSVLGFVRAPNLVVDFWHCRRFGISSNCVNLQALFDDFNTSPNRLTTGHSIHQRCVRFLLLFDDCHRVPQIKQWTAPRSLQCCMPFPSFPILSMEFEWIQCFWAYITYRLIVSSYIYQSLEIPICQSQGFPRPRTAVARVMTLVRNRTFVCCWSNLRASKRAWR